MPAGSLSFTGLIGGDGGESFNRLCPEDAFVYGFESKTHNSAQFLGLLGLCEVQVKCGRLISENGVTTRMEAAPLAPVGTCGGADAFDREITTANPTLECSDNKVAVGMVISSTDFVTGLTLRCASLTVEGEELIIGLDPISSEPKRVDCPSRQVAVGIGGNKGYVVDQMGLGCKEIEVTR